ncbi:restriction endonuclease [Actinoallomurus iriomotensis]|uniref:Restriction endonuclease n=1 Tax=Actinoallomurus iriomotensis TaxID=478107 RepID=A0A9W6S2D7_9ACTN|nr:restriction endonuclease [Actinoallomurus iriomotensis]GLY85968.1 restriction endonuclease [Actinoallomurus iriomotensis]
MLDFFTGAGVPDSMTADLRTRLRTNPETVKKFATARTVLNRINQGGDRTLRARREVLKRVCEYEDFSTCWPEDRLKAQGLVAAVRKTVHAKDSFTRMRQEQERERHERLRDRREALETEQRRRAERQALRSRLAGLSSMGDAQQRGIVFEGLLNDLFAADGLLVRESFALKYGDDGIVEQIDGLIDLDGQSYLVEAKWWSKPLGTGDTAQHLVRVHNRADVRGLIISTSGFTAGAIRQCTDALATKVVVLAETPELLFLLEQEGSLADWLRAKVRAATVDRIPLHRPSLRAAG